MNMKLYTKLIESAAYDVVAMKTFVTKYYVPHHFESHHSAREGGIRYKRNKA